MRVAFNASTIRFPLTGVGGYTLHLAQALSARGDLDMRYFLGTRWADQVERPNAPRGPSYQSTLRSLIPFAHELLQARYAARFMIGLGRRTQLIHEPAFLPASFARPTIVTIHDLSFLRYPETHPSDRVRVLTRRLPNIVRRAAHIVTDSEFGRQEVIGTFGVAPQKVTAIALGAAPEFRPRDQASSADVLSRFRLQYKSYVLSMGTLEPRKNLALLLDAYESLPPAFARAWPLIVAGFEGWKSEAIHARLRRLASTGVARYIGYVPQDELAVITAAAAILVYPSIYEGFGLPVLEAMASGTAVIAANRSSLPEVLGDAGVLVASDDAPRLAQEVRRLCEDTAARTEFEARGLARCRQFSWDRCAEETVAVYRRTLAH